MYFRISPTCSVFCNTKLLAEPPMPGSGGGRVVEEFEQARLLLFRVLLPIGPCNSGGAGAEQGQRLSSCVRASLWPL